MEQTAPPQGRFARQVLLAAPRGRGLRRFPATLLAVIEQDWTRIDAIALAVLAAQDGIAHVSVFDTAGLTRRQTAALYRRGVLARPRIGWYADPALPWQVKHAVRVGGIACCVTAAALWGLPIPPDAHRVLHVLVAEHEGRLRHNRDRARVLASTSDDEELRVHRRQTFTPAVHGRTSLPDTLTMLFHCVPTPWWIAALDAASHMPRDAPPLLGAADFTRFAAALPRRQRRLLRLVDARCESPIETLLRLGLLRRGLRFEPQFSPHPRYRVDFLLDHGVVVEVDGAAFHDPDRDAARDDHLAELGYRVLRFGYERVVHDLEGVLDEIERILRSFA